MKWLKAVSGTLGALRDGLLVLAGFVYACGYVVWSVFSFTHQLGPRSALDAQYFVAGIIPALALGGAAWFFVFVRRLQMMRSASTWHVLAVVLVAAVLAVALWAKASSVGWLFVLLPMFVLAVTLTFVVAIAAALDVNDAMIPWTMGGGSLIAVLLTLLIYAAMFYGRIPMELGGGQPRCVVLELDRAKIGSATLQSLRSLQTVKDAYIEVGVLGPEADPGLELHSELVQAYLWAMTDNRTLLGDGGDGGSYRRVEIPTEAISAIIRCRNIK